MRQLQQTFFLEKKVGKGLGRSEVLQPEMQEGK